MDPPQTIGIDPSVSDLFPPAVLVERLEDVPTTIAVIDEGGDPAGYDGVITFEYREAQLSADPSWIHCVLAGVDAFPLAALEAQSIALTNSTGIHGDAVGETVLGYMLQFARRLHRHRDAEDAREWEYPDWNVPFTLRGETVCVVGLGTLGRGVAARADAVGMDVVGVRRTPTPVEHVDRLYTPDSLSEAVSEARFVVLTVPLTDRTRGLVGADELAAMREDAYLVNVARGPVVDQDALVETLRTKGLAGAALDVTDPEPLPDDSPLWEMDDVVVTPHAAAATRDYVDRVATIVRENLRRLKAGESLANRVV
ncbi:D-2-hydroxyacid dehydrogenase [Halopenitus sp. H-Gu1]|uniref:D-2-hydroxyacid dehydrogenase n=1 Tax=Halopenitus sp. H-Gu1 TaxID=3242697 RepID=UPI00359ED9E7